MNLIFTLAFRNLVHDRLRLIATVVGIVFFIVFVTIQLGVFLARAHGHDHDRSCQRRFLDRAVGNPQLQEILVAVGAAAPASFLVDGVTSVTPLVVGYASWRKPNGGASTPVLVVGAPTNAAACSPLECSRRLGRRSVDARAVAIDAPISNSSASLRSASAPRSIIRKRAWPWSRTASVRSPPRRMCSLRSIAPAPISACRRTAPTIMSCASRPNANAAVVRSLLAGTLSDAEVLTPDEFRHRSARSGCSVPAPARRSSAARFSAPSSARSSSRRRSIRAPRTT